jgi:hypothetical protein
MGTFGDRIFLRSKFDGRIGRSGTFSSKGTLRVLGREREREKTEAFLERNALTPEGSGNALYAGRNWAFRVSCFLLPSLFSYPLSQRFVRKRGMELHKICVPLFCGVVERRREV